VFGEPGAEAAHGRARAWRPCSRRCRRRRRSRRALRTRSRAAHALSLDRVEDADWVALTQRQFDRSRAGERLWIVPTWHDPPDPGAINVVLDPGAASAPAAIPTTRLVPRVARARGARRRPSCSTTAAARASSARGVEAGRAAPPPASDVDPRALEAGTLQFRATASPRSARRPARSDRPQATITVANILANPLRVLAPHRRRTRCGRPHRAFGHPRGPGGRVISRLHALRALCARGARLGLGAARRPALG
jgi:ribosomal protein L11 methyltransferase